MDVPIWVAIVAALPISGILTAVLTAWANRDKARVDRERLELETVQELLEMRRTLRDEQEKHNAQLRERVDQLEGTSDRFEAAREEWRRERDALVHRQRMLEEELAVWRYAVLNGWPKKGAA